MDKEDVATMRTVASLMSKIAQINARVAGMVAANMFRTSCGNQIAYSEEYFFQAEAELNETSRLLNI